MGDVADVTLLRRSGQDLAPGREDDARAGRGEVPRLDPVRDLEEAGAALGQVAGEPYLERAVGVRVKVQHVQGAELLVDDGARPGRGRLEIEPVILLHLADA